jgi:amino acid adenylation domain-containing protein
MQYINSETKPSIVNMSVHEIYADFNKSKMANEFDTVRDMLLVSMAKYHANIAVQDGEEKISYKELREYAFMVSQYIMCHNNECADYVILTARRDWKTVGAIVGILLSGLAYVPIHEDCPPQRLDFIKKELGAVLFLDSHMDFDASNSLAIESHEVTAEQIAYVLFTSGTSGTPKGVAIPNKSVTDTVQTMSKMLCLNEWDAVLGVSDLTFDLSVFDLFSTLFAGARLVLLKDNRNPAMIFDIMSRLGVTTVNTVPYMMKTLMEYIEATQSNVRELDLLRTVIMSGDVVPPKTVDMLLSNLRYVNVYIMGGPTEITVWSNIYLYSSGKQELSYVPYGVPIPNKTMYIMKEDMPVIEEEGEIVSGGIGLAQCYLGNDELTDSKFCVFGHMGRCYRTGDKGILTCDGLIQILGRMDNQVQVNGYRVELEDIEKNLGAQSDIKQAIACVIDTEDGSLLVAGVETVSPIFDELKIKETLKEILPSYAIPSHIVQLPKIPLTANNKIDRTRFGQQWKNDNLPNWAERIAK